MAAFSDLFHKLGSLIPQREERFDHVNFVELLKKSPTFRGMTDDALTELTSHLEPLPVKPGEVIVREGDEGDYFYLIAEGEATVCQRQPNAPQPVEVARLDPGRYFGEEALLANARRNATVTMATKGVLMRLNKEDFEDFLKQPRLTWVSRVQALDEIRNGARWLDVRTAPEFARNSLPNALSLPLKELRAKAAKALDPKTLHICCCQTGRLSATAAFLLFQMGYKVAVLRGGLQRFPGFQSDSAG